MKVYPDEHVSLDEVSLNNDIYLNESDKDLTSHCDKDSSLDENEAYLNINK
ncbi:hypothetical protein Glove_217g147 [Diversispora epigaea]|uniref:Uncharacterized protein n=1 Tax=Diversispora epigaea TaxID=1348612 RepID=A0A397IJP9_9GLOM|nr:hypothetical protein Glove_217g147 [Diversispora epigaea]